MANPIQAATDQLANDETAADEDATPIVPSSDAVRIFAIPKSLSSNIISVRESSLASDPILAALGGSYVFADGNLQTIAASEESFDPPLVNLGSSGSVNNLGTHTSKTIIQAIDPSLDLRSMNGATNRHSAYNLPFAPVATAAAKYNFYVSDYERFVDLLSDDAELAMLDIYGTVLNTGRNPTLNDEARQASSAVDWIHTKDLIFTEADINRKSVEDYFREYATTGATPVLKYENVIYPWKNVTDANSDFALAKGSFPFYISFDIGMAPNGGITKALMDSNFADNFVYNLAASIDSGEVFKRTTYLQQKFDSVGYSNSREYDMNELLSYSKESFMDKSVFLGSNEQKRESYPWMQPTFERNLDALQLLLDIKNTIRDYSKTYQQIIRGEKNYSEVLAYRVAKFDAKDMDKPIQNFYFFNSYDADTFNFTDSQVVPGKLYRYKVYAYTFVCEGVYTYEDISLNDPFFTLDMKVAPDSVVVENMIYETDGFVTSLPPLAPSIEFRSFLGNERKLQVLFQEQDTKRYEQPISFNYEESKRFELIRESQGLFPESPVAFANDDETVLYEIFRTKTPPSSPASFSDKLWRRVVDTAVIENVRPDTTYYYIFRSIDNHGNVSNPSPPFEVTLVGGVSPYLIVTPYQYTDEAVEKKQRTKNFKRFLRIAPSLPQMMISKDGVSDKGSSLNVTSPSLGVTEQGKIWGKKYKIRITSKETGKKIDFNLEYDYNFDYREQ